MLGSEAPVSNELQEARRQPDSPIRTYFDEAQRRGEIRDDLSLGWIMSAFQALSLVAMQDQRAGLQDDEEASRSLSLSLIAMLEPRG